MERGRTHFNVYMYNEEKCTHLNDLFDKTFVELIQFHGSMIGASVRICRSFVILLLYIFCIH